MISVFIFQGGMEFCGLLVGLGLLMVAYHLEYRRLNRMAREADDKRDDQSDEVQWRPIQ